MKAIVYAKYGAADMLQLKEIEKPIPNPTEMLIQIHATSVTSGDVRLRSSDFPPMYWLIVRLIFGLFKPKKQVLGHEFSGVVIEKGDQVKKFNIGDEVVGTTTMLKQGSYAEFICVPEQWKSGVIGLKPKNLDFEKTAVLPIGGMTALFLLKKAGIQRKQNVLIYGASGSVGSYAIQIAKAYGAKVTGVCSTTNLEMVKALGADQVIDYKQEDYTTQTEKFDIVFDAVGKTNKSVAKKVLHQQGKFVSIKMITQEKEELLQELTQLVEAEKINPFIDKTFPLEKMVEAHQYVDTGRKKGNVSIKVTLNI